VGEPDSDPIEVWRRELAEVASRARILRRIEVVASTASTMDLAAEMPSGTWVTCLEQTAGRGRRGRAWFEGGAGVAATAIFEHRDRDPLLSARAGLAMHAAVEPWLGRQPGLKWPNDLMMGERKLGGVLVERSGSRVHVGVGINVETTRRPAELADVATSLAEHVEAAPSRLEVACRVIPALEAWMTASEAVVRAAWRDLDWLRGRVVRIRDGEVERTGRIAAVEAGSHLELVDEQGRRLRIAAATAEILAVAPELGVDPLLGIDVNGR